MATKKPSSSWAYGASEGAKAGSAFGPWGTVFGAAGGALDQGLGGGALGEPLGFTPYDELGGTGDPFADAYKALQPPEGYSWKDVFGKKPNTAVYRKVEPVNNFDVWQQTLAESMKLMDPTNALVDATNAGTNQTATNRVNWIDSVLPGFQQGLKQSGSNTNALLNGQLSRDDATQMTREGNDMRSLVGTPGNFGNATARDLGLKQYELQQQGQQNLAQMAQMAEMLNPFAAQVQSRAYQKTPLQATAEEQWNKQFQSSEERYDRDVRQSKQNIKAAPDPVAANLFAALQQLQAIKMGVALPGYSAAQQGGGGNDWAALTQGIAGIYGQYKGSSAAPANTGVTPAVASTAPAYPAPGTSTFTSYK